MKNDNYILILEEKKKTDVTISKTTYYKRANLKIGLTRL